MLVYLKTRNQCTPTLAAPYFTMFSKRRLVTLPPSGSAFIINVSQNLLESRFESRVTDWESSTLPSSTSESVSSAVTCVTSVTSFCDTSSKTVLMTSFVPATHGQVRIAERFVILNPDKDVAALMLHFFGFRDLFSYVFKRLNRCG